MLLSLLLMYRSTIGCGLKPHERSSIETKIICSGWYCSSGKTDQRYAPPGNSQSITKSLRPIQTCAIAEEIETGCAWRGARILVFSHCAFKHQFWPVSRLPQTTFIPHRGEKYPWARVAYKGKGDNALHSTPVRPGQEHKAQRVVKVEIT